MLEGVPIVLDVVIVVVRVGEKVSSGCEYIAGAYIGLGQKSFSRFFYLKNIFAVAVECLAQFVSQVGIGVLVAYYFYCVVYLNAAVVGGYYGGVVAVGQIAEQPDDGRVAQPR